MTEKKELTRRLETGDTFMNHEHGNDLLYAYLYYLSTWDKNTQQLYLTHKNYLKEKKVLMEILLCKSTRTVDNQLKKLLEQGILKENIVKFKYIKDNGQERELVTTLSKEIFSKYRFNIDMSQK